MALLLEHKIIMRTVLPWVCLSVCYHYHRRHPVLWGCWRKVIF